MIPIRSFADLNPNGTYTYADYLTWQLGEWVKLVRGRVRRMSPAPTTLHQRVSGSLHSLIRPHLRRKPCEVFAGDEHIGAGVEAEFKQEVVFGGRGRALRGPTRPRRFPAL